jgi:hypothetical protein
MRHNPKNRHDQPRTASPISSAIEFGTAALSSDERGDAGSVAHVADAASIGQHLS